METPNNASQIFDDLVCDILRRSLLLTYHSLRFECDETSAGENSFFHSGSLDSTRIIRAIDLMDRKWWIVILGCLTHATNTGFAYFGLSAFFPSFEREFGWS